MTRVEENKRFRHLQHKQASFELYWQPRIKDALDASFKPVIEYLKVSSIEATMVLAPSLVNIKPLQQTLNRLWFNVGVAAANDEYGFLIRTYPEILQSKAFGFNQFWRDIIQVFLDQFGSRKITGMLATDQQVINRLLQEALDKGYDTINAAKMILGSQVNVYRSRLIARTELLGASSMGAQLGAVKTGLAMNKTWLSVRRKTTRRLPEDQFDHWVMDHVSVAMNDKFVVPGKRGAELMNYPGDQENGSAGNVCNCLCRLIYEPQRDRSGRLIRI